MKRLLSTLLYLTAVFAVLAFIATGVYGLYNLTGLDAFFGTPRLEWVQALGLVSIFLFVTACTKGLMRAGDEQTELVEEDSPMFRDTYTGEFLQYRGSDN